MRVCANQHVKNESTAYMNWHAEIKFLITNWCIHSGKTTCHISGCFFFLRNVMFYY